MASRSRVGVGRWRGPGDHLDDLEDQHCTLQGGRSADCAFAILLSLVRHRVTAGQIKKKKIPLGGAWSFNK